LRRILLLATLITLIAAPQTFAGIGWIKSVSIAQQQAKEKKQVIFVDLFAEWCGWCHKFEADVYPSEPFQNATEDMVLLRLDTEDGNEGTQIAQKFGISTLPTFLMLNADLSVVGIIRGYAPPADFAKMIDNTLQKNKEFLKMVESEKTIAKDYQKRLDLARELRFRQSYAQSEPRLRKLTFEKSVPVDIRDQAFYELGALYFTQGKYDDVLSIVAQFSKVQKSGDSYERARLLKSDVCLAQGNLRCAANELRDFKKTFPQSPLIPNIERMLPTIERQITPKS
jgi:thioredoxin-related protein